jgi:hypothetical protein
MVRTYQLWNLGQGNASELLAVIASVETANAIKHRPVFLLADGRHGLSRAVGLMPEGYDIRRMAQTVFSMF